jgi:hypothetical protein
MHLCEETAAKPWVNRTLSHSDARAKKVSASIGYA